jgi:hypothetical protein
MAIKNPYERPGIMGTHYEGCGRAHSACAFEEGVAAVLHRLEEMVETAGEVTFTRRAETPRKRKWRVELDLGLGQLSGLTAKDFRALFECACAVAAVQKLDTNEEEE